MGAKNPSQESAQTLTLCTCEHECNQLNRMLKRPIGLRHVRFWSQLNDGYTQLNAYSNMAFGRDDFSSKIWPKWPWCQSLFSMPRAIGALNQGDMERREHQEYHFWLV